MLGRGPLGDRKVPLRMTTDGRRRRSWGMPPTLAAIVLAVLLGEPLPIESRRSLAAFILRALRAGVPVE